MTDRLTDADTKYWHPPANLTAWLADRIPENAKVLDVGAGILPFQRANVLVDIAEPNAAPGQEFIKCDFSRDPLPFPDKSFDFIYCRHVLEDMFDPFFLCREMQRVGKAGYIETPSPMAEMCRGIDGSSPPWRGYYHHHFVIWPWAGELGFMMKYPLVEYLNIEQDLPAMLRPLPRYWNTHYLWKDEIKARHHQSLVDFHLFNEYGLFLNLAMEQGRKSCDEFWSRLPTEQISQSALNPRAA